MSSGIAREMKMEYLEEITGATEVVDGIWVYQI
jgi:hypothetical protein